MRRYTTAPYTDSETEYSETDESIIEGPRRNRNRAAIRRRSMSRRRRFSPDYSNTYLSPVQQDVQMHRSASTGGRRPREQAPAVIVDIQNDSRNKSSNRSRRTSQNLNEFEESDDEEIALRAHQRPRASTGFLREREREIEREVSPRPQRDYDLVVDQRILEKNDVRQDMELMRQQQEIERLERELARRRERKGSRMVRDEEEWYEDEIREKLRRLERLERRQFHDEERKRAEMRWKMHRFEEEERAAAEREEVKAKLRVEKLKEMEREREEEEEKERIKKEIREEDARRKAEEEEKRKKMIRMKQEAVEEWKLAEEKRALEEQKEKEEKDKEFRERLKCEYGYTEEEIERILAKRRHGEVSEGKLVKHKEFEKTTWIKVC